ncbi:MULTISPECIES: hypothetical protein [Bradyrhizobium]|uniref:hypothetical protein n=1 Tax=Bradyrhizobium TaxID=374 RepID=UPI001872EA67|nr:hypothetical protein [Bradyrhizobium elkanii]MCP1972958.1 hypothetical protein [Bradyrhizobium elkanii]MCS3520158.1 hypothetical protein [Bradyrhizobium elkanii]MCS4067813.1 hypothetical protein [Bradyrhizobium elkanii]MCS4083349.1 hypothetical protein [Bradyrhizobium elkanii]MCS4105535.1 hypothetical protein [Bradyrhizobium elkanii]
MDTAGVITSVAAIITVGAAVVTMAGTGAITTVGGIITATGGDFAESKREGRIKSAASLYRLIAVAGRRLLEANAN